MDTVNRIEPTDARPTRLLTRSAWITTGLLWAVLGCSFFATCGRAQIRQPLPNLPGRVIDEVSSAPDRNGEVGVEAITVDSDDHVRTYRWDTKGDAVISRPKVEDYLGESVQRSGDLSLAELLPKGRAATAAVRATYGGTVFHVIVAWQLDRESLHAFYDLYVLAEPERTKGAHIVYSEEMIEMSLDQFLVRDLSGDGSTEIIDVGSDGGTGQTATIRKLARDGTVRTLQGFDDDEVLVTGDATVSLGYTVFTTDRQRGGTHANDPCRTVFRVYDWSKGREQFVLESPKPRLR